MNVNDTVLLTEVDEKLQDILHAVNEAEKTFSVNMNAKKTK